MERAKLLKALERAGVYVEYDDSVPTAMTRYDEDRDSLACVFGKLYSEGDEATKCAILAHEFGHIMRGDLLVKVEEDTKELWNVAADALINEALDHEVIRRTNGVLYENLCKSCPTLPPYKEMPHRAQPIYEELVRQNRKWGKKLKELEALLKKICGLKTVNSAKARRAAARAFAKARVVAEELGADFGGGLYIHKRAWNGPIPPPNRDVANIVSQLQATLRARSSDGILQRVRSYARPGRIEGLRGVFRRRRLKLVVLADVSGSMTDLYQRLTGALLGIQREHDVIYIAWSTTAKRVRSPMDVLKVDVGGGTVLQPALNLAATLRPDAALIISDAELGDKPRAPEYPVFWAIYGSQRRVPFGKAFPLRSDE